MDRLKRTKSFDEPPVTVDSLSSEFENLHTHSLQQTNTLEWEDHITLAALDSIVVGCKKQGDGSLFIKHMDELGRWLPTATIVLERSAGLAYPDKLPLFASPGKYIVAFCPTGHLMAWDYYGHCFFENKLEWNKHIVVPNAIAVTSTAIVVAFAPEHSHSVLLFVSTSTWRQVDHAIMAPPGVLSLTVDPLNPIAVWGTSLWGLFSVNTVNLKFAVPILALDVFKAFGKTVDHREQVAYATAADSYRQSLVQYVAGDTSQESNLFLFIQTLYSVQDETAEFICKDFQAAGSILHIERLDETVWCEHIYHTGSAISLLAETVVILVNLSEEKKITVFPLPAVKAESLSCCPIKNGVVVLYTNCTLHYLSDSESDVVFLKRRDTESHQTVGAPPTGLLAPLGHSVVTHTFEDELFVCQVFA